MKKNIKTLIRLSYNSFVVLLLFLFANTLLFVSANIKADSSLITINSDVFLSKSTNTTSSSLDFGSVVMVDDLYDSSVKEVLIEYTVVPGDTLYIIATRFGTTSSNIMKVNGLTDSTLRAGKRLYITPVEGFVITLDKVTNPMIFANIYGLDLDNLMTTNGITDKLKPLPKGDDLFIPIDREKGIEIGLLEEPKPIAPKPKTPSNTIVLKKTNNTSFVTDVRYVAPKPTTPTYTSSSSRQPHIISQWTYSAPIINGFYKGQCTWFASMNAPWAFPYIDKNRQFKSRRGDAKYRFANAKKAGFVTSPRPSVGAIMVIGGGAYGHVTMVKDVDRQKNRILVEGMNFIKPYVVTKRWIYMDKTMTKVVANSKYVIGFIPKQETPERILTEVKKQQGN